MWYETGFCDLSICLIFPRSPGLGVYKVFYIKPRIYQSGKPAAGSCSRWELMEPLVRFFTSNMACIMVSNVIVVMPEFCFSQCDMYQCRDRDHSITTCIFPWKQLNKEWSLKPLIYPFWFVSQYKYKDNDAETHFLFVFQMKKKIISNCFPSTNDIRFNFNMFLWVHENLHLCINVKTPQVAPVCKCQQIMKYENIFVFQIRC